MAYNIIPIEKVEEALRNKGGFVSQVARDLGVSVQSIHSRIRNNKCLQKVKDEVDCQFLDLAESQLVKKLKEGDRQSIFFFLKYKGMNRGYVEKRKIEHSSSDGMIPKIQVEFVDENPKS